MFEEIGRGLKLTYDNFGFVIVFAAASIAVKYFPGNREPGIRAAGNLMTVAAYVFLFSATLTALDRRYKKLSVTIAGFFGGGLRSLYKVLPAAAAVWGFFWLPRAASGGVQKLTATFIAAVFSFFSLQLLTLWIHYDASLGQCLKSVKKSFRRLLKVSFQSIFLIVLTAAVMLYNWQRLAYADSRAAAVLVITLGELIRNGLTVAILSTLVVSAAIIKDSDDLDAAPTL